MLQKLQVKTCCAGHYDHGEKGVLTVDSGEVGLEILGWQVFNIARNSSKFLCISLFISHGTKSESLSQE